MSKFQIGDNVVFNKNGVWAKSEKEYHAVIIGGNKVNGWKLFVDERFREHGHRYAGFSNFTIVDGGFTFFSANGYLTLIESVKFDFDVPAFEQLL